MVLGLDCATQTGWCVVGNDGKPVESGVMDFSKRRGESNGLVFLRFRKWLTELIQALPEQPSVLSYERAHFRGGAATELCVGLQTRVQEICAELGIESAPVATTTLKKSATGTGRAGKDQMIDAARTILGRDPIDDNEADAVHVALWGAREYGLLNTGENH